jgi:hypothetical protein
MEEDLIGIGQRREQGMEEESRRRHREHIGLNLVVLCWALLDFVKFC